METAVRWCSKPKERLQDFDRTVVPECTTPPFVYSWRLGMSLHVTSLPFLLLRYCILYAKNWSRNSLGMRLVKRHTIVILLAIHRCIKYLILACLTPGYQAEHWLPALPVQIQRCCTPHLLHHPESSQRGDKVEAETEHDYPQHPLPGFVSFRVDGAFVKENLLHLIG